MLKLFYILCVSLLVSASDAMQSPMAAIEKSEPEKSIANPDSKKTDIHKAEKDWFTQFYHTDTLIPPPFSGLGTEWVDSVYNSLSLEEKIGQLLMVSAYSNKDEKHYADIERYVRDYKIGGLIFMQGSPYKQAELNNRYQAAAKVPLMIGFDGEWGLAMRLDSTISYPRQLMLGAIQDNDLIYQMGIDIGKQMRRMGIHVNFAPVIDINNNPNNPVINDRSFGDDIDNVSIKGLAYMSGLQHSGILACGKHFPGHGDTDTDSHYDLPVINQSRKRLDSIELKPFKALADRGLGSMMVAHLSIPALDPSPNLPSTLSRAIVDTLLRQKLGFKGLVFTDAMNMKGVTKYFPSGKAEVLALLAGNDIMLFPDSVDAAVKGIRAAVDSGQIPISILENKVKRILQAKFWMGLNVPQQVDLSNLTEDITSMSSQATKNELTRASITALNAEKTLPLQPLFSQNAVCVTIGQTKPTPFTKMLDNYDQFTHLFIDKEADAETFDLLLEKLSTFDRIVVNIQNMSRFKSKDYGLTTNSLKLIDRIPKEKLLLVLFNTPYALFKFNDQKWPDGKLKNIIIAYNEDSVTQEITAQALFGVTEISGKLPVKVGKYTSADCSRIGMSSSVTTRNSMGYALPEEVGMNSKVLAKIDSIATASIKNGVFPGCQILVARNNKIVYEKAFGHQTYAANSPSVKTTDLYDIASVTKIAGTLPLIMHLYGEKRLLLDGKLWQYLPEATNTNKKDLTIRELLSHQSGLAGWIPFYKNTIASDSLFKTIYSKNQKGVYQLSVTGNLFMNKNYIDTMWAQIYAAPLNSKGYKYSDLGFYFMKQIIERRTKFSLDAAFDHLIAKPMGLKHITYLPLKKGVPLSNIIPTEQDDEFRKTLVHGYVHDPGAAMMGGVGGHAGLFSNAHDLAVIMQMYLNKGVYGPTTIFPPEVMDVFNKSYYPNNRRALGFDKPIGHDWGGPTCPEASSASFGHQGFTGTVVWADPENGLVYAFLSNRINPTAENKKINSGDIRQKIQQIAYQAIEKP